MVAVRLQGPNLRPRWNGRLWFWLLAIALGVLQTVAQRHHVGPDGTPYIEIAQRVASGDGRALANGYWSPLYPLLLGSLFRVFHPSLYWESTAVHLLNFAIYLAALFCFEIFFGELLVARAFAGESGGGLAKVSRRAVWSWGYLLFLWGSWFWSSPAEVTPDLCVVCGVFLATAGLLRIIRGAAGWGTFAALGAVLGAGYWAKAAMFPLAFVFLLSAYLLARGRSGAAKRVGVAAAVFLTVAAPFLVALSETKGRVTFGDSGRLNYAWYANRVPKVPRWQGQSGTNGVPVHPIRRISSYWPLYEFGSPVAGSFPPWYDPSYWYEGLRSHFDATGQLVASYRAASGYLRIWSRDGTLYFVALAIFLLRRRQQDQVESRPSFFLVWLPSIAALVLYGLVHVEPRFVGGFGLVLLAAAFSAVSPEYQPERRAARLAGWLMIAAPALAIGWNAFADAKTVVAPAPFEQWRVAEALYRAGISPGTRVGVIGMGLDAYWAHLAGVRIIAEIPEGDEPIFANAASGPRQAMLAAFATAGASALITDKATVGNSGPWHQLGDTEYYVLALNTNAEGGTATLEPTLGK